MELVREVRVGAGTHAEDHLTDVNGRIQSSRGADTDDVLYPEEVVELIGIDADGRHTHTARHNRYSGAFKCAGIAVDATYVVHENRIVKKRLCNEFRAERVTRHQNGAGEIIRNRLDMRSRIRFRHHITSCNVRYIRLKSIYVAVDRRAERTLGLDDLHDAARAETGCAEIQEVLCVFQ